MALVRARLAMARSGSAENRPRCKDRVQRQDAETSAPSCNEENRLIREAKLNYRCLSSNQLRVLRASSVRLKFEDYEHELK
jgi:hypothetical protein